MKRTAKRSRSGAETECPQCGKKLRGEKGLKMHVAAFHAPALDTAGAPLSVGCADISPARGEIDQEGA